MILGCETIWELLDARAAATPDHPMLLVDGAPPVTFGEFRARTEAVARVLVARGVEPGAPVVWQLPTSVDAVVTWAALARIGAQQVPLIAQLGPREVAFVVQHTGAVHVLLEPPVGDAPDVALPPPSSHGDAERFGYFTSGTTADPKGVRHTDRTLIAGGEAMADSLAMTAADVGSIAFPFAHIAGPDYVLAMLVVGCPAVLLPRFDAAAAVDGYRRLGVTMAGGSTAFYQAFLGVQRQQPGEPILPSLRLLSGGGAPLPPAVWYAARDEMGVRILHGYALTECPMAVMNRGEFTDDELATTSGVPVRGVELRLADDGEIQLRGEVVCKGYTDPALDAAAWDPDGRWFRTGDLGSLVDGRLVVTGRKKDIIIRKGENISAIEVENLVATHPSVAAAAVVGLPDDDRGELVCACVELVPGAALDLATLIAHLRAMQVMTQKLPERLEVFAALPRGGTLGKVLKTELRQRLQR